MVGELLSVEGVGGGGGGARDDALASYGSGAAAWLVVVGPHLRQWHAPGTGDGRRWPRERSTGTTLSVTRDVEGRRAEARETGGLSSTDREQRTRKREKRERRNQEEKAKQQRQAKCNNNSRTGYLSSELGGRGSKPAETCCRRRKEDRRHSQREQRQRQRDGGMLGLMEACQAHRAVSLVILPVGAPWHDRQKSPGRQELNR